MNNPYPHSSAIILTDNIYNLYGGDIGDSTEARRNAAFFISEFRISNALNTYLLPTTVTGTYQYNSFPIRAGYLELEHAYVNKVNAIWFYDTKETNYYSVTGTANIYASIRNSEYGILDIHSLFSSCGCGTSIAYPYHLKISYDAGLPTGTATQPVFLQALVIEAEIALNELIGYGNEAPGDAGIKSFNSQDYSEDRFGLQRTNLGDSPRANYAYDLIRPYVKTKFMRAR